MDKKKTQNNLPDNNQTIDNVIPIAKIIELRKRGNTYKEIGRILGCTKQNIALRLRPFKTEIEALPSFKEQKADVLAVYQQKILNSLTPGDIKSMPVGSRLTGFGLLYVKERLVRGQSTANVAYKDLTGRVDEINAELAQLEAENPELAGLGSEDQGDE